ncbi:MAG TPA: AAA family ATPase [Pyrinomonadaceae bacterium]|nr:AAA family ATPase [Pyrinomonadaceae bacterium]
MVVLINGSFGVGKSTVARLLRGALPKSVIYDPEPAGVALMRLSKLAGLKRPGVEDFQHFRLWRRSAVAGVRLFRGLARGPVIVPMTFTHRPYFDEVVAGIRRFEPTLRVFCLTATLPTVKERLSGRGDRISGPGSEWLARRIVECAEAHQDTHFGEQVETEGRDAREVADDLLRMLRTPKVQTV